MGATAKELADYKHVPWQLRGGGYMQITNSEAYTQFFNDPKIKEMGIKPPPYSEPMPDFASYVSKNYPMESAVWF